MWADAQRDGCPAEYGGALCESSVIPFLVPRRKFWLTTAARVPCSNAANVELRKTWTHSEFCMWRNSVRGLQPRKFIYSVPAKETAKHRAKFGWPAVNDVAAVKAKFHYASWFGAGSEPASVMEFGFMSTSLMRKLSPTHGRHVRRRDRCRSRRLADASLSTN